MREEKTGAGWVDLFWKQRPVQRMIFKKLLTPLGSGFLGSKLNEVLWSSGGWEAEITGSYLGKGVLGEFLNATSLTPACLAQVGP